MFFTPLQKYLYWSVGLHLGVFLALLIAPSFLGKSFRFQQEKVMWVSIPKGTSDQIGSPLKKAQGLPKSTIEEQKKAMESPPPGQKKPLMSYTPPQQKAPPKPQTPPPPRRLGHPDSRVDNALARIQKQVATKKVEMEAGQVPDKETGGFTYGNTNGQYVSPQDPEYVLYQLKIRQRIMNQWILPAKYAEQASVLICRIIVHINESGDVSGTEWDQKSGDPSFDLSAQRAIQKASPLDIPPDRLKYEVFNEGFAVEFKPTPATPTAAP